MPVSLQKKGVPSIPMSARKLTLPECVLKCVIRLVFPLNSFLQTSHWCTTALYLQGERKRCEKKPRRLVQMQRNRTIVIKYKRLLSPHFLSQVNTLVVDVQVIGASETLPTLFTLVRSLT